jgi:hypothetical protein
LVYCAVFAVGAGFAGTYLWRTIILGAPDLPHQILLVSCAIFVLAAVAAPLIKTRPKRVLLTILSAVFGGIQGYLDLALFPLAYDGFLLFFWLGLGVLLMVASVSWVSDLSRTK